MCTERLQTLVIQRSKQVKSNWKVSLIHVFPILEVFSNDLP